MPKQSGGAHDKAQWCNWRRMRSCVSRNAGSRVRRRPRLTEIEEMGRRDEVELEEMVNNN
jgi:hypothetical protein